MPDLTLPAIVPVGTTVDDTIDTHLGRVDARRLIAALVAAWDAGDTDGFVACFVADAEFVDETGTSAVGAEAIRERIRRRLDAEPFRLHWISNEEIVADRDGLIGSWLWSSATSSPDGEAWWAGGDLRARFVDGPRGRRIGRLELTDRYRTPYVDGWLDTECHAFPSFDPGSPDGATDARAVGVQVGSDVTALLPGWSSAAADESSALAMLEAERRCRRLIARWGAIVDPPNAPQSHDADALAERATELLHPSATVVVDGDATSIDRLVVEPAWIRPQSNVAVVVSNGADRAACRWRDLSTAVVDATARWVADDWSATATPADDGWRFAHVERRRLLDVTYDQGWRIQ